MADKDIKIKIDTAINAEPTLKALRELKQLQREVVAGSEDYKKIQARINDIGDAAKTAKGQSEDWIDTLSGLPGPLGMVGRGLDTFTSSTNKLGLAFKSLGIGLIVAAIGALTAAFSQNEKMTKKLEPLMIGFQKILGGIFAAIEPVIDAVISLAVKALPMVTDAFKVVYSAMSSFLQGIGKIGSAIYKLFTGDFKGAWEDAKSSVMDFGKRYDESVKNFEKGASEMTEIEKKNLEEQNKKRAEAAKKREEELKKRQEAEKAALEERKKQLDAEIQLEINKDNTDRARLEKLLAERLRLEGKKGAELELLRQENSKKVKEAIANDVKAEEEGAKAVEQIIKNRQDFNRKIEDLSIAAIENQQEREIAARQTKLNRDLEDLEMDKEFIQKSEKEKEDIRMNIAIVAGRDIEKIKNDARNKELQKEQDASNQRLRILEIQGKALIQGTRAYYDNRRQTLDELENAEKLQLKKDLADKKLTQEQYESALLDVSKKYSNQRIQEKKAEFAAIAKIISTGIDAFASLTAAIASSLDEEAKVSKEAFEKRKKILIGQAVMQTASGIINVLTAPMPGVDPITQAIIKGVQVAALVVKTGVEIGKIKKTTFEGGQTGNAERRKLATGGYVSGPGTSTSDSIPASLSNGEYVVNARATSAFLPLLNSINEAGRQPRFAMGGMMTANTSGTDISNISQAITSSLADRPIKTYVVSQDMSNSQQFDRTIKSRSVI